MQRALREQKRQRLHTVDTPDQAVELILKGERVILKDTQQVHTVLSKLGELAIQAKKDGKEAKNWDPCSITVKGTNLFCNAKIKTKEFPHGVPRIEMPQFKSRNPVRGSPADNMTRDENGEVNATQAFLDDLAKSGVTSSDVTVLAGKLKASQAEMEGVKVAGMMLAKERDPKKQRITVSKDNYIVDGHHTWAAAVGRDAEDGNLDNDMEMEVVKINLPMSQIYQRAIDWTERMGLPKAGVKKVEFVIVLKWPIAMGSGTWDKSKHPRDPKDGRFIFSRSGSSGHTPATTASKDRVKVIKKEMAVLNKKLLPFVRQDDFRSPEAQKIVGQLKALSKKLYREDADPGGFEGISLPGGPRDVVIIGAGPAGLSAAINGATEGLDTLYIEAQERVGGQAGRTSRVENLAGFPGGVGGRKLTEDMHEQAQRLGAEAKIGVRVLKLEHDSATGLKTLHLSNGETIITRSVVLATGLEARKDLNIPGIDSPSVTFLDGETMTKDAKGGDAVVVGGSNAAAQAALGAAEESQGVNKITVLSRSPIAKGMSDYQVEAVNAEPKIKTRIGDELAEVITDLTNQATHVRLKSGEVIPAKAVGIFIGQRPNTSWLPPELSRTEEGLIHSNRDLETTIPGVFVAGDNRAAGETENRVSGRVGAAVGEGQVTVANIFRYFDRMRKVSEGTTQREAIKVKVASENREEQRKAKAREVKEKEGPRWDALVDAAWAADYEHPLFRQIEIDPAEESVRKYASILRAVS